MSETEERECYCDACEQYVLVHVAEDAANEILWTMACPDCGKGNLFVSESECDQYYRDLAADRKAQSWKEDGNYYRKG